MAMLGKLSWELIWESTKLWAEVFRQKYLNRDGIMTHTPSKMASSIWKIVIKSLAFLKDGYVWRIGNG